MKKNNISKDEKICFALDYMPVEKKYKKQKICRNIVNILTGLVAAVSLSLGLLGSLPAAATVGILGSMVLFPSMYVFNSKMRETIETANQSNITYRQFKKMEHSGELQKVIQEAKIMQASPVSVGIEKFTQNNISTQQYQVKSPQFGLLQVKNNDGRNS